MKHPIVSLLLAAALATAGVSTPVAADGRVRPERLSVWADVVDVRPVHREARFSEPRRECWIEEERYIVREGPARYGPTRYGPARPGSYERRARRGDAGGAIVGGVIGGVVGNRLGRHSNRGARAGATIAGAVIGSAIVREAAGARHRREERYLYGEPARTTVYGTRPVERCRTVGGARYERRLQHYDVTYRYQGRRFTTRLPRDPGPRLELNVSLMPARR